VAADLVLRGRIRELAALDAVLAETSDGVLRTLFVEGEAGIGKSALLAEFAQRAERCGFVVCSGAAAELEAERPFGAIRDAMGCMPNANDPRRRAIADLLAAESGAGIGVRFRVVDGLLELLESSALQRPVALVLDDIHWADASTLLTVASAIRRLTPLPIAVCAAFRPLPADPDLQRLVDAAQRLGAQTLAVGPLENDAIETIARDRLEAIPVAGLLTRIHAASGNPLLVIELMAQLSDAGLLRYADGQVDVAGAPLPASLHETILRRLSYLPHDAIELLRACALLGGSFTATEASAVTGAEARDLLRSLQDPVRARLIETEGALLRFRHELIRVAIYEDIPLAFRRELHRQAARALAGAGCPTARVASQFVLGATPGDREAVDWLRRAAAELSFKDPPSAVALLRQAIDLVAGAGPEADELRCELVTILAYSGRPDDAERAARDLLASSRLDPSVEGAVRAALVQCLFVQGRWGDVVAEVDRARPLLSLADAVRARLLAEGALARIWTGDLDRADADAREAIRLGERCGDPVSVSLGLGHLSVVADQRGELHEGVELAQRGLEAAIAGGAPEAERRHPHIALGMALLAADRLAESKEALQEGRRLGERMGTVWDLPLYHTMLALPMLYLGEWDDAMAEAESALVLADELGSGVGRVTAHAVLATIAVHQNALTLAGVHVNAADALVAVAGPQWGMFWLSLARAALLEAEGDAAAGFTVLREQWAEARHANSVEACLRLGPAVARAARRGDDDALAKSVAQVVVDAAARACVPYAEAAALLCSGLVDGEAQAVLAAADLYAAGERRPEQAAAHEDAAVLLAQHGSGADAASHLETALSAYDHMGASRDAGRALARMRELGVRRGTRMPQVRASTGWSSLTHTELEVVGLAVQGLTNKAIGERLFISHRTVQTHLAHVFGKLDISSRVQLAAAWSSHD
jgi:DNA-binding CsgD family transcriptional regulator/tetratricopeptide (TPR) repeat protein